MDKIKLQSIIVPKQMSIKQAMHTLNETAEKILFVVDEEGRAVGTITDGDIRRGVLGDIGLDARVEAIMQKNFVSLHAARAEDLRQQATELMVGHKIEHIPVLDSRGVPVEVVSWRDFFSAPEKKYQDVPNRVVVMAGGKGTRLDPFTRILPKPLIPIGEKAIIELIMERFAAHGFSKFAYTLNYKKEYIKIFLQERQFPYEITWVEENDFLGTAGSLALLKDKLGESFFVVNCDTLLNIDFAEALAWHKAQGSPMTVIGAHSEVTIPFGVLTLANGMLEGIKEKPNHDVIINAGMYILEPEALLHIPENTKIDMNELITAVAKEKRVAVYPVYGKDWLDIGQWAEYRNAVQKLEGKESGGTQKHSLSGDHASRL